MFQIQNLFNFVVEILWVILANSLALFLKVSLFHRLCGLLCLAVWLSLHLENNNFTTCLGVQIYEYTSAVCMWAS